MWIGNKIQEGHTPEHPYDWTKMPTGNKNIILFRMTPTLLSSYHTFFVPISSDHPYSCQNNTAPVWQLSYSLPSHKEFIQNDVTVPGDQFFVPHGRFWTRLEKKLTHVHRREDLWSNVTTNTEKNKKQTREGKEQMIIKGWKQESRYSSNSWFFFTLCGRYRFGYTGHGI